MAKFIAAYIAHGHKRANRDATRNFPRVDHETALAWKRLYCLFSILRRHENETDQTRYILYSDHHPPQIEGLLIGSYLKRLGVEIVVTDYLWRPDSQPERHDFFIFDAFDQISSQMDQADHLLLFGPNAIVLNNVAELFTELAQTGILLAEAPVGEVSEKSLDAYRSDIRDIRQVLTFAMDAEGMTAIHPDFIGLTGDKLHAMLRLIRRLVPRNDLRGLRRETFLTDPGEILAAIFAELGFHHPNVKGLVDGVAAMPDEVEIAQLKKFPVAIPGYGREPDIQTLFKRVIPDCNDRPFQDDPVSALIDITPQLPRAPVESRLRSVAHSVAASLRHHFHISSLAD